MAEEARRDQFVPEMVEAPKYSVCFSDLAEYLNVKEEVMQKVAQYNQGQESAFSLPPPLENPTIAEEQGSIEIKEVVKPVIIIENTPTNIYEDKPLDNYIPKSDQNSNLNEQQKGLNKVTKRGKGE